MMAMAAVVFVLIMVAIAVTGRGIVIGMPGIVVVMIVGVYALCSHILSHVPMQSRNRRPGKLERNDNHDDQGDEAAHSGHCTVRDVFTKGRYYATLFSSGLLKRYSTNALTPTEARIFCKASAAFALAANFRASLSSGCAAAAASRSARCASACLCACAAASWRAFTS